MSGLVNSWVASAMLRFGRYQVAEKRGERFLKLAAEARSRIMEISPLEAVAAIRRGARVFDVREKEEFLRGHLPNAAHLGRGTLELEIEQRVPNVAAEIVVYCGGGNRSALSAENLQRMGTPMLSRSREDFRHGSTSIFRPCESVNQWKTKPANRAALFVFLRSFSKQQVAGVNSHADQPSDYRAVQPDELQVTANGGLQPVGHLGGVPSFNCVHNQFPREGSRAKKTS